MARRIPLRLFALAAILLAAQLPLYAQTFDATHLTKPTGLDTTWLIQAGDNPSWAQPGFDDSHWTRFNPNTSIKTVFPNSRPQIVWYRLHVKALPSQTDMTLSESSISTAFEIYANGQKIMQAGSVVPFRPAMTQTTLIRPIPAAAIAAGPFVIALRVHLSSLDWTGGIPGLYRGSLIIGPQDALVNSAWLTIIGQNGLDWFTHLAYLGLGIVALALYGAERRRREYLWIFLMALSSVLPLPLELYRLFHAVSAWWFYLETPREVVNLILMVLIYCALLRIPIKRRMQVYLGVAAAGYLVFMVCQANSIGNWLVLLLAVTPYMALLAAVIPGLLIHHWRRGNREAGILLIPAFCYCLTIYTQLVFYVAEQIPPITVSAVRLENLIWNPQLGPIPLSLSDLGDCLFALSLAVIIVLRSTRLSRQQAVLEGELAAAREIQQVILPEHAEAVPGFNVESVYLPAEQVGGDFFQVLPTPDGGLLAVVGDVAGKGLPAAMLVSMLVGAVRAVFEYTSDPAELLANLNERLVGRSGGFSTALIARICAANDGDCPVALANAGHLPPYLDGKEIELPGALPLGVVTGAHYQTVRFRLSPGSRLTFYSDGIVEAQNRKGEMFGFDRARELSTQPAAAIVAAAQQFGQQDDMTVVSIERPPPQSPPLSPRLSP
ncbi:MAG: SpoIIE family protein phosphatase [Terracidiphilus sp.]